MKKIIFTMMALVLFQTNSFAISKNSDIEEGLDKMEQAASYLKFLEVREGLILKVLCKRADQRAVKMIKDKYNEIAQPLEYNMIEARMRDQSLAHKSYKTQLVDLQEQHRNALDIIAHGMVYTRVFADGRITYTNSATAEWCSRNLN